MNSHVTKPVEGANLPINKSEKLTLEIMGILNCTPDSFSDGGKYIAEDAIQRRVHEMAADEVDIIDIGGESTRPGASVLSDNEEWDRIEEAIKFIKKTYPQMVVSVDTYKSSVARNAISEGADIINDISGGTFDTQMLPLLSESSASYIIMHIKGVPSNMQIAPFYHDVIEEVTGFLRQRINACVELGIKIKAIDPGIGFGKTIEHNRLILNKLESFRLFGYAVMIGVSRKSLFKTILNLEVNDRDIPTVILESLLVQKGASIIRTHNTKYASYLKTLAAFVG